MIWTPYRGERYLDFVELTAWCEALAAALPEWVSLESVGQSRHGRPLWLLTISASGAERARRPGFWLDGGTHASEFTGICATLYAVSRWAEALERDEGGARAWFSAHQICVMPCLSPDGFQAMCEGAPFLRSTLRPPMPGTARAGLEPQDLDGDGAARWMRWRNRAGAFVPDEQEPLLMRPRRLDDDPDNAFSLASEGIFLQWDGGAWAQAPRQFGLDLNRNFPGSWAPFSMFGMDGGDYALSEPESRAAVDAFAARPALGAALTNHTYTGCLLTQPYRERSPLGRADLDLMEWLAKEAVEGTGYPVYKVHPEFTYDASNPIGGVWADTLATVFGVPGYTLELWNPLAWAGVQVERPLDFLLKPDLPTLRALVGRCVREGLAKAWTPFSHPQLGPVELGGLDYLRTVRNPPEALLAQECERGFVIADRLRRALPSVSASVEVEAQGDDLWAVSLTLENQGFLSTSGLSHGATLRCCPPVSASLGCGEGLEVVQGQVEQGLEHIEGWGAACVSHGRNPLYPSLGGRGQKVKARWWVRGEGVLALGWSAGRGGQGARAVPLRRGTKEVFDKTES